MSGASVSPAPAEAVRSTTRAGALPLRRLALLALGVVAMAAGLYGGLWRLGWDVPHAERVGDLHGVLLICGLFGTVISLERAVAFARPAGYAAPLVAGGGSLALIAGAPPVAGALAYVVASVVLLAVTAVIALRQRALFTATLTLAAACWTVGTVLWGLGWTVPEVVGWWMAFLVLTIAGERLELSRLLAPRRGSAASFAAVVLVLLAGAGFGPYHVLGAPLLGVGFVALTGWLARHDVVRITLRRPGQTGFMATCMAAGYVWLGVAGLLLVALPPAETAFGYDAALHAVLVGFVLSMVFGHALIILPAVVRVRVAYRPALYVPLALLHASVALRVLGDAVDGLELRAWSGPLTLVALVGFVAVLSRRPRT